MQRENPMRRVLLPGLLRQGRHTLATLLNRHHPLRPSRFQIRQSRIIHGRPVHQSMQLQKLSPLALPGRETASSASRPSAGSVAVHSSTRETAGCASMHLRRQ